MPIARTEPELDDLSEIPMTAEQLASARRVPRVRSLRRALGLTQQEFSVKYRIPLAMLSDWEQGRAEPDAPARALLEVIAREPEITAKALQPSDAA